MLVEKRHYPLMIAICASLFSTPLMMAGVNAALPQIAVNFNASAAQASLIGASYSLGLAVFQLAAGTLGDIQGHRRIFLTGAIIFCCSSFMAGFLNNMPIFLALRFIQGMGGALLSASGLALVGVCSKPENRPAYLGATGIAVYAGIACGPPIAGLIAGTIGWRWLFWFNALTNILVWLIMKQAVSLNWRPAQDAKFDYFGAMLYAVSMTGLTFAASRAGNSLRFFIAGLSIFVIFFLLFIRRELKCHFPLVNFSVLAKNRLLSMSALAAFINYAAFFGLTFYFSYYLQVAKNFDATDAGLILSFCAIGQIIGTRPATKLCGIWPHGRVSALGAAVFGIGLLGVSFLEPNSSLEILIISQILLGAGISAFAISNTSIMLTSAGMNNVGMASSLTGAMRTAGQLISMIIITISLGLFLSANPVSQNTLPGFMNSMHLDLILFGILNICAIGLILVKNINSHDE